MGAGLCFLMASRASPCVAAQRAIRRHVTVSKKRYEFDGQIRQRQNQVDSLARERYNAILTSVGRKTPFLHGGNRYESSRMLYRRARLFLLLVFHRIGEILEYCDRGRRWSNGADFEFCSLLRLRR